jgi:hypothetical protein
MIIIINLLNQEIKFYNILQFIINNFKYIKYILLIILFILIIIITN